MTKAQALSRGLPLALFVRAIGRTRDVEGDEITAERLEELDASGRPTYLLSLDGRPFTSFPPSVQNYLLEGESRGINRGSLISQRRPWYKMESRKVPPFLFAYLGRRKARFVKNVAGVVPLTGFLCVYPVTKVPSDGPNIWPLLNHPETLANLSLVGKSYGSGAIKVEPRALERVPVSDNALRDSGLIVGENETKTQYEIAFH